NVLSDNKTCALPSQAVPPASASSPALLWTIPSALNHGESGAKQCVRQAQILACGKSAALRPGGPTCFLRQSEERRKLQAGSSVRARLLSESRRDVRHPNLSLRSRFCPRFALAFDRLLRADRDRKSTRLNSSHVSISYAVF